MNSEQDKTLRQPDQFCIERDSALLSLNVDHIRLFLDKWSVPYYRDFGLNGDDNEIFWVMVHKTITWNLNLPIEFRRKSKAYLDKHGLKSWDDGDL